MTARRKRGISFEQLSGFARTLPGLEEGFSYGTPAFRVRKKFLGRQLDAGESFVIRLSFEMRDDLVASDPKAFVVTPHYEGSPMLVVRRAEVDRGLLEDLLVTGWKMLASKGQLAEWEG